MVSPLISDRAEQSGWGGGQTTTPNDLRDGNLLLHDGRLYLLNVDGSISVAVHVIPSENRRNDYVYIGLFFSHIYDG